MIDKIKEIQDILISRFNNTITGSLIISFVMMNSRGLLIFAFSDNETRLNILRNWQLDLVWDCLMPLLISAIYITLIPLASAHLKKHITNKIYKIEQNAERDKALISLSGMQDIEIARVKSTSEYAEKYAENEIKSWINERDETISNLKNAQEANHTLVEKNTKLAESLNKSSIMSNHYLMLYERSINTMSLIYGALENINKKYPAAYNSKINHARNTISEKNNIIILFASAIKNMLEMNNAKPTSVLEDWLPPINESSIEDLTLLLDNIKNDEKNLQAEQKEMKKVLFASSRTIQLNDPDIKGSNNESL